MFKFWILPQREEGISLFNQRMSLIKNINATNVNLIELRLTYDLIKMIFHPKNSSLA